MKPKLQELRKRAGYKSARAFAETIGIPKDTYTGYEQGKSALTLERAWYFADVLGEALGRHVSLDELAGRDWPPPGATATAGMDEGERELIGLYRSTDERGRDAIMTIAESQRVSPKADELPAPVAGLRRAG